MPTRRTARLALLLAMTLAFTVGCSAVAPLPAASPADVVRPLPPGTDGTVERVVDGDTVVVDGRSVRLTGIDTPETVKSGAPVGCYGPEASRAAKGLLPVGSKVRLVTDTEHTDRYDRDLRYVYRHSDGLFVQAYLVREGFARTLVIRPNTAHREDLAALEQGARAMGRGLWGAC